MSELALTLERPLRERTELTSTGLGVSSKRCPLWASFKAAASYRGVPTLHFFPAEQTNYAKETQVSNQACPF